jgi:hypothetical protein
MQVLHENLKKKTQRTGTGKKYSVAQVTAQEETMERVSQVHGAEDPPSKTEISSLQHLFLERNFLRQQKRKESGGNKGINGSDYF